MNLLDMAAKLFASHLDQDGTGLNMNTLTKALAALLPTQNGELDIAALVSKFSTEGGALATMASSWLGDGGNLALSGAQIKQVLGADRVAAFADDLGLGEDKAAAGLASMLPELIDKSSEGGSVLAGLGKADVGSLLGKLF